MCDANIQLYGKHIFKNGIPVSFLFILISSTVNSKFVHIKFADDWIPTADLVCGSNRWATTTAQLFSNFLNLRAFAKQHIQCCLGSNYS